MKLFYFLSTTVWFSAAILASSFNRRQSRSIEGKGLTFANCG